jgi:hypothetical protein
LKDKITLFEYGVYLNEEGGIEIHEALLDKEKWEAAMEEFPDYENTILIGNFLEYLKKLMHSINSGITTYF